MLAEKHIFAPECVKTSSLAHKYRVFSIKPI